MWILEQIRTSAGMRANLLIADGEAGASAPKACFRLSKFSQIALNIGLTLSRELPTSLKCHQMSFYGNTAMKAVIHQIDVRPKLQPERQMVKRSYKGICGSYGWMG